MCVVSNIGDDYSRRVLPGAWPTSWPPFPTPSSPAIPPSSIPAVRAGPSRDEFDNLFAIVMAMKADLEKARKQDIEEGNADCEMDDKVKIVKEVAKLVGVDLGDVFPNG